MENLDLHYFLAIDGGIERFSLADGQRAVLAYDGNVFKRVIIIPIANVPYRASAIGVRCHIHQYGRHRLTGNHSGLDGRAHGNAKVGVDVALRFHAKFREQPLADHGCAGAAANQQNLVNVRSGQIGPAQGDMHRLQSFVNVLGDHRFIFVAGQFQ